MSVLSVAILVFGIIETLNVITLYVWPGSQRSNGVGVFNAWERSKSDPELHQLVKYLVFWVAGTKLIFVALLAVILLTTGETTKVWTVVALILSILSFFWRMSPIARALDSEGHMTPPGYSKALKAMVGGFAGLFALALILSLLLS